MIDHLPALFFPRHLSLLTALVQKANIFSLILIFSGWVMVATGTAER